MQERTRRTRFEERVRVEREFLAPINRRFGEIVPLAGMTAQAIDVWERRAAASEISVDVARIAAILREAAARAELLADNSRDVFQADRPVGADGLTAIRRMLDEALAS